MPKVTETADVCPLCALTASRHTPRHATQVRRSRTVYPDGWELIEPTLKEFEKKMRDGKSPVSLAVSNAQTVHDVQPRTTTTRASDASKRAGISSKFTTNGHGTPVQSHQSRLTNAHLVARTGTFTTSTTSATPSARSCTSFVSRKSTPMLT